MDVVTVVESWELAVAVAAAVAVAVAVAVAIAIASVGEDTEAVLTEGAAPAVVTKVARTDPHHTCYTFFCKHPPHSCPPPHLQG